MNIKEMILSGNHIRVTLEKKIVLPKTGEGYKTMGLQGGGSDGKYGFFVMNEHGSTAEVKSRLFKVDLDTWEIVAVTENLYMCHANDIAYDSKHDRLLVSNCNVNSKILSVIDPKTAQMTGTLTIPVGNYAIAYNKDKNLYVAGKSAVYDISVMDEDFNELRVIPGEDGFIKQGMECDNDFIYMFHTGVRNNWIWVYTWEGEYITRIPVPMAGESEFLFRRGDHFIAGFNSIEDHSGAVYEMRFEATGEKDRYRGC